jgi:hypothetical protein
MILSQFCFCNVACDIIFMFLISRFLFFSCFEYNRVFNRSLFDFFHFFNIIAFLIARFFFFRILNIIAHLIVRSFFSFFFILLTIFNCCSAKDKKLSEIYDIIDQINVILAIDKRNYDREYRFNEMSTSINVYYLAKNNRNLCCLVIEK